MVIYRDSASTCYLKANARTGALLASVSAYGGAPGELKDAGKIKVAASNASDFIDGKALCYSVDTTLYVQAHRDRACMRFRGEASLSGVERGG